MVAYRCIAVVAAVGACDTQIFRRSHRNVTEGAVAEAIACGPDPQQHIAKIREAAKASADYVKMSISSARTRKASSDFTNVKCCLNSVSVPDMRHRRG